MSTLVTIFFASISAIISFIVLILASVIHYEMRIKSYLLKKLNKIKKKLGLQTEIIQKRIKRKMKKISKEHFEQEQLI